MALDRDEDHIAVWDIKGHMPECVFFRFGGTVDQAVFKLMRIVAVVDAIWVPVLVSFGQLSWFAIFSRHPAVIAVDLCLDSIYALGVLLQLRISVVDLNTAQEYVSPWLIFLYRMQSSHFWLDFLSVFGILWYDTSFPQYIAAVRLFRLWRASNGADDLYELHNAKLSSEDASVNMVMLLLQLALIIHIFACSWFFASTVSSPTWEQEMLIEPRFYENTFGCYYLHYISEGSKMMRGWGSPAPIHYGPKVSFTLSMGYGMDEYLACGLLAPLTSVCTAWILSQLLDVIQQTTADTAKHLDQMSAFSEVLDGLAMPWKLKHRCLRYHSFMSIHNANQEDHQEMISGLSERLQDDIKIAMFESFVRTTAFFRMIPEEVMKRLILAFEEETFGPDQNVIRQGDTGDGLYFIIRGSMDVIVDGVKVKELLAGQHFGELELLYDRPRSATIRSSSFCMCASLSRHCFQDVLESEPLVKLCIIRAIIPASRDCPGGSAGGQPTLAQNSWTAQVPVVNPNPSSTGDDWARFDTGSSGEAMPQDVALFRKQEGKEREGRNPDLHRASNEISRMCSNLETHLQRASEIDARICTLEDSFRVRIF